MFGTTTVSSLLCGGFFPIIAGFCFFMAIRGAKRSWARRQEEKLLESNPEAWLARKRIQEEAKEKRDERVLKAAHGAFSLAKLFLRK